MPDFIDTDDAGRGTPDIRVTGDPDMWKLICKASSARGGWMRSTKAMKVDGGTLYQVSTEHRDGGVVLACAEALAFVPDLK